MLKLGETKVTKGKFYAAKKPIIIWVITVDNIVISNLVKTKTNSKYFIGHLDKVIRPLGLIMLKMSDILRQLKLNIKTID